MKFSPAKIRDFKFDPNGPRNQRQWDSGAPGLGIEIYKTGKLKYIFRYRIHGKQKFIVMGYTGDIDLQDAQHKASEFRQMVAKGVDPKLVKV